MTYNPVGEPGQAHPSDTFSVTLRSVWGDTWEWPAVTLEQANFLYHLDLGPWVFTQAEADSET